MKRPRPFRPGDLVRVVKPLFVHRVGYPKGVADYLPEVDADLRRLCADGETVVARLLGIQHPVKHTLNFELDKSLRRVRWELAYLRAKGDRFGGRERSIHTVEHPLRAGMTCRVSSVRTVYTGRYYPPSFTSYYEGDCDSEPGGLEDARAHRLATVTLSAPNEFNCVDNYLEIEVANLQHAEAARANPAEPL